VFLYVLIVPFQTSRDGTIRTWAFPAYPSHSGDRVRYTQGHGSRCDLERTHRSIKTIILKQVQELCELMGRMDVSEPGPIKLEYIGCLRRLGAVKSGLHSISEVFLEVDWAAFDQVLTNGYKAMGG